MTRVMILCCSTYTLSYVALFIRFSTTSSLFHTPHCLLWDIIAFNVCHALEKLRGSCPNMDSTPLPLPLDQACNAFGYVWSFASVSHISSNTKQRDAQLQFRADAQIWCHPSAFALWHWLWPALVRLLRLSAGHKNTCHAARQQCLISLFGHLHIWPAAN